MSAYIVSYDIISAKRRSKVAKVVYGYALGGQKSVLEVPVSLDEAHALAQELDGLIDPKVDKPEVEVSVKKSQLFLGTQGIPLRLVQVLAHLSMGA